MARLSRTICPRCDGTGDEPGAPSDIDLVPLCTLCGGKGAVLKDEAIAYRREQSDEQAED